MRENTRQTQRSAFDEAAEKCGVPTAELKLWLIENIKVGSDRWSTWQAGVEAVPDKHLVAFLRARMEGRDGGTPK